MTDLATLAIEGTDEVRVARLAGELDASNVAGIGQRLYESIPNMTRAVVLDFRDTRYVDSSGVRLIFETARQLKGHRQELRLVVPPRSVVADVFNAVSMGDAVQIHPSLADALRAVGTSV
jgi:anti-anti-sigma factor